MIFEVFFFLFLGIIGGSLGKIHLGLFSQGTQNVNQHVNLIYE